MHFQLNYKLVKYRSAEQHRAGEQARRASEAQAGRRSLRDPNPLIPLKARTGPEAERAIGGAR
jgi:hypothetical protein